MQFFVTFLQQIEHTVPVYAKSFEEAESKADMMLSENPNAYKRDESWFLECISKDALPF